MVRNHFFLAVILIAGGLITAGLLEIYFRYSESLEQVHIAQQAVASRAAFEIERFIRDVATSMTAFAKSSDADSSATVENEFELRRLLFLAPAITEVLITDARGIVKAQVSRFRSVAHLLKKDLSQSAAFQRSRQGQPYFGAVYFRDADPYLTVAVPIEPYPGEVVGVLQAETSLRDILDVVSGARFGAAGYRYVVTRSGELIAHSNINLVLRRRDLTQLGQVKAAFSAEQDAPRPKAMVTYNTEGKRVFSSYALIPIVDWAVFIELPVKEAYAPVYASLLRTSILLLVGLGVALLASAFVARRVVRPLETLRQGVEQIGRGNLSARLDIKTGDEIEILGDEFNKMAAHLREAYTGLERKVAERTHELTVANKKLEDASQLKSQFLASVNHELRTPLSAIISYGGLILSDPQGRLSGLQKDNLQDLLHNAARLLDLIDSLLDISTIEAGRLAVRIDPVDVEDVIRSAVSTIESNVDKNHVRMFRHIAPNLPAFNTDREKLKQILVNLLDNAAKFTERGEIRITAAEQNGSLKLVVSDTGIGIPEQDLNKVFEEFHRAGTANGKKYRGTGLGLAIVKRLVGLLGGNIEVASKVGEGSSFTVTLPLEYKANRGV